MPQLVMLHYWKISRAPRVEEIQSRLLTVFSKQETKPVLLPEPMNVHTLAEELYGKKEVPFQSTLEQEFGLSLDWVRIRLGQEEALQYLRTNWLVHGTCILFKQRKPDIDTVRTAVQAVILRRRHVE